MKDKKSERYSFHLIRTTDKKGYPVIDATHLNHITGMARYEKEKNGIGFNIDLNLYAEPEAKFNQGIHSWILDNFQEVERIDHYILELYRNQDFKLSGGVILLSKKRGEENLHKILDHQDAESYLKDFAYFLEELQEHQQKVLITPPETAQTEETQKVLKEYETRRIALIKLLERFYEDIRDKEPIKKPALINKNQLPYTDKTNQDVKYFTLNRTKTFQVYTDHKAKTNKHGEIAYLKKNSKLANPPIGVGRHGKAPYIEMILSAGELIPQDAKNKAGYTIATPEHGRLIDMVNSEIFKNLDINPTKPDALDKLKDPANYPIILNIKNVCSNWNQTSKVTEAQLNHFKTISEQISTTSITYLDYADQLKEYNKHKKLGLTKEEINSIAYIKTSRHIMNPKYEKRKYKNGEKGEFMIFEHYSDLPIFTEQALLLNQLNVIEASRYRALPEKLTPKVKDYHKLPKNRQSNKVYKEATNEQVNRARHYLKGLINDGNYNMEHGQRKRFYKDNRLLVVNIPGMLDKLDIYFETRKQKYNFFKALERMLNESVIEFPHLLAFKITQKAKNQPKEKILFCYIKDPKKGIGNDQVGKNIVLPSSWNTEKTFPSDTYLL